MQDLSSLSRGQTSAPPPTMEAQSLNCRTAREVPCCFLIMNIMYDKYFKVLDMSYIALATGLESAVLGNICLEIFLICYL